MSDNIIRYDFVNRRLLDAPTPEPAPAADQDRPLDPRAAEPTQGEGAVEFSEEDRVAMPEGITRASGIISASLDGSTRTSFIMIGMRPTETGMDFMTAWNGSKADIGRSLEYLDGVIRRMCHRSGIQ